MDPLDRYLDQVCRGIGGPRELRDHVRQELREHLQDAVGRHVAAGLPEPDAVARALDEFGRPDLVRSELEATHGHRVLGVVIDKALQWKEKTMRAKWLWATWAYLGLATVVALEALFITFLVDAISAITSASQATSSFVVNVTNALASTSAFPGGAWPRHAAA